MIPPSIIMIVYGVTANVSIAQLFIAGVLPGLMLALLFLGYIVSGRGSTPARCRQPTSDDLRAEAARVAPPDPGRRR